MSEETVKRLQGLSDKALAANVMGTMKWDTGASIEMMARLRESIVLMESSTSKYSKHMERLTRGIMLLAIIQISLIAYQILIL